MSWICNYVTIVKNNRPLRGKITEAINHNSAHIVANIGKIDFIKLIHQTNASYNWIKSIIQ